MHKPAQLLDNSERLKYNLDKTCIWKVGATIKKVMDREVQISLQKFNRLHRLATRANIVVLMELLVALRLARGDVAKIDRLTTAISYVLNYSVLKEAINLKSFSLEVLEGAIGTEQFVLCQIFEIIDDLPLKWGAGTPYENYASLPHNRLIELFEDLLQRPDIKFVLGAHLVVARRYLDICVGLLELARLKRIKSPIENADDVFRGGSRGWACFLFSRAILGHLLNDYYLIQDELAYIQLPLIPFPQIDRQRYLLSEELIASSLMVGFVHLKDQLENHICDLKNRSRLQDHEGL